MANKYLGMLLGGVLLIFTMMGKASACDETSSLGGWQIQPQPQQQYVVLVANKKPDPCPDVPDATYQGGGVKIKTVKATACFEKRFLVPVKGIVRRNGTYEYTVALVYNSSKGTHEVVRTVYNNPCWTQNLKVGTWMAVYVTCRFYTGWVAAKITGKGDYVMRPVSWRFKEIL